MVSGGLPDSDDQSDAQRAIHFQEWWVRYRAQIPTYGFAFVGADKAAAGPGVTEAIADADVVLLAPSNPVVSIGAILAVPGIRGRCARRRHRSSGTPHRGRKGIARDGR